MKKAYIAGPWFTPEQMNRLEAVKTSVLQAGAIYYSPKDECLFTNINEMDPFNVVKANCDAIESVDFVIAITDGKDVGTMWECGYAYAKSIPIIYVWLSKEEGQKFNLMLAASGAVTYTLEELKKAIRLFIVHNEVHISVGLDIE
jgi:nucleoside 2-deoxyribosyltransferase